MNKGWTTVVAEDFSEEESESDDETTIAKAEKEGKKEDVKGEMDALEAEADMEFDDFLSSVIFRSMMAG